VVLDLEDILDIKVELKVVEVVKDHGAHKVVLVVLLPEDKVYKDTKDQLLLALQDTPVLKAHKVLKVTEANKVIKVLLEVMVCLKVK